MWEKNACIPDPLGPTTAVKLRKGPTMWWPSNDLKLKSSIETNPTC